MAVVFGRGGFITSGTDSFRAMLSAEKYSVNTCVSGFCIAGISDTLQPQLLAEISCAGILLLYMIIIHDKVAVHIFHTAQGPIGDIAAGIFQQYGILPVLSVIAAIVIFFAAFVPYLPKIIAGSGSLAGNAVKTRLRAGIKHLCILAVSGFPCGKIMRRRQQLLSVQQITFRLVAGIVTWHAPFAVHTDSGHLHIPAHTQQTVAAFAVVADVQVGLHSVATLRQNDGIVHCRRAFAAGLRGFHQRDAAGGMCRLHLLQHRRRIARTLRQLRIADNGIDHVGEMVGAGIHLATLRGNGIVWQWLPMPLLLIVVIGAYLLVTVTPRYLGSVVTHGQMHLLAETGAVRQKTIAGMSGGNIHHARIQRRHAAVHPADNYTHGSIHTAGGTRKHHLSVTHTERQSRHYITNSNILHLFRCRFRNCFHSFFRQRSGCIRKHLPRIAP